MRMEHADGDGWMVGDGGAGEASTKCRCFYKWGKRSRHFLNCLRKETFEAESWRRGDTERNLEFYI